MKQIMKYSWGCLLALVPALIMPSCEDEATVGDLTSAVMPASIELIVPAEVQQYIYTDENGAKVLPMLKGETVQMNYGLQPENVTYRPGGVRPPGRLSGRRPRQTGPAP